MKRFALLLFVGLFGLATLQTASAQDLDDVSHTVTLDVYEVSVIDNLSPVTIDVDGLNSDKTTDETPSFDILTNLPGTKVTAQLQGSSTNVTGKAEGLQLEVKAINEPGNSTAKSVSFTSLGDGLNTTEQNLLTGFSSGVDETVDLEFTAQADETFDPTKTAEFEVTYTLTTDGGS